MSIINGSFYLIYYALEIPSF